jgi:hypothetical protein
VSQRNRQERTFPAETGPLQCDLALLPDNRSKR